VRKWGQPGSEDGNFSYPQGIAVNATGYVYITDTGNNRVQVFTPSGNYVRQWGQLGYEHGKFTNPQGTAVIANGDIVVADSNNNRIQEFTPSGTFVQQWGSEGTGNGQFENPYGLAADKSGNVYVADATNDRIQKFLFQSSLTVMVPNGGTNWQLGTTRTITWSYTGNPGPSVKIELLRGTAVNRTINASTSIGSLGSGSYSWKIPDNQAAGTDYKVRITSTSTPACTDKSDTNFTISAGPH